MGKYIDYYQVLGINSSSNINDIKKAYREMAKIYHPDKNIGEYSPETKHYFEERFKRINEAYKILSDQDKRELYDIEYFQNTMINKNKNRKSNIDSILEKINNDKSEMLYTTITKEGKVIAAVGLSLILIVNGITTLNTKNNKKVTKNVINNERLDNYREVNVLNRNYLVSKDDTLESIAIETNTSVEMIKELNGLDTDELVPGESLYIPYAISSEDLDDYTQIIDVKNMTINEIADAYNTDIETLISLNDEAIIQSGDDLIILSDTLVVPDFEEKDKNKNKSLSY